MMKRRFTLWGMALAVLFAAPAASMATQTDVYLYGHLISSQKSGQVYGIFRFTSQASDTSIDDVKELKTTPNAGGVKVRNRYYCFNIDNSSGYGNDYYMFIYDVDDNFNLITRTTVPASFVAESQVLAYDPTTQKVYTAYVDGYAGNVLATLDLSRRTKERVGLLDHTKFLAMAFNKEGRLFGITNMGALYEIDKTNANLRYIGSTGVSPADYQQSATFSDYDATTLYWAATTNTTGDLYSVDVTNAQATLIKTFPHEEEFAALWAGTKVIAAGAPAAATDLITSFPQGALKGTVSFKAPDTTHSGATLSGTLQYTLFIDDMAAAHGTVEAGQSTSCAVTVSTTGLHDVHIVLSNDKGEGDRATLRNIYIGKDTPSGVESVVLDKGTAPDELVLTWDAPSKGVHGGYVDLAAVKYIVKRMPDDVVVSTHATSPFRDTFRPDVPTMCFYDVIPYIDEESKGLSMSSNKLLVGKPFEVPYAEDFSTNQRVLCYAIEDANADGTTWEYLYEYGYMRISSGDKEKDDWLFTPFIAVKKDKTYKLSFDVRSIAVETIEVKYGIHPMASAMTEALLPVTSVDTDYDWKRLEQTFTATSDAPLFIGFHACNTDVAAGHSLYIDNVKVEEVASTGMEYAKKSQNYRVENGQLTVTGTHAIDTRIYRADGTMLFSGILRPGNVLSLPRGLVIVRVADEVAKLIVE